jgi:hypothetical protein
MTTPPRASIPRLLLALLLLGAATRAAESPAAEDAIRRQAAEVERLRDELRRAEAELQRLQPTSLPTPAAAAPGAPPPAPLAPAGELVAVRDLVLQYQADAAAADAHYRRQVVRIRGEIVRFDPRTFQRAYDVQLASPAPDLDITCGFAYAPEHRAVFTRSMGRDLVARISEQQEVRLLRVGEVLTVEGRCQGWKKGVLHFSGCRIVRQP